MSAYIVAMRLTEERPWRLPPRRLAAGDTIILTCTIFRAFASYKRRTYLPSGDACVLKSEFSTKPGNSATAESAQRSQRLQLLWLRGPRRQDGARGRSHDPWLESIAVAVGRV